MSETKQAETRLLSTDQLDRLKRGLDLIGDVQVEMALADDRLKNKNEQWLTLYSIRCDLGKEFYRLKQLTEAE